MTREQRNLLSPTEEATAALGAALARALPPTPPPRALRLYLTGDLGAGKTTLVRGLLRQLGVQGAVRSPTYSLLEHYAAGGWQLLHLDLYRLGAPQDLWGLGLADHDGERSLWMIEWPERAALVLPAADLELRLQGARAGHSIALQARSEPGERWLESLGLAS